MSGDRPRKLCCLRDVGFVFDIPRARCQEEDIVLVFKMLDEQRASILEVSQFSKVFGHGDVLRSRCAMKGMNVG